MADASQFDSLPLTDREDALRRAGDRPDVAREMFGLLKYTLEEAASNLRGAIRDEDPVRLREAAHRLHGACLYCGVPRLHAAVADVEALCRAWPDDPAPGLEKAVERLLEAVEATRLADDPL